MNLLELNALAVDVEVAGARREIVREVNLSLAAGEAIGLVGESGSGKSMTLRAILRLLPRSARVHGKIHFDGLDVLEFRDSALRRYLSEDVATVFQNPQASINPLMRIGDFICESLIANRGASRADAHDRALRVLEDVGVTEPARRMNQHPHELSGGLLQRVMIASALIGEPRLLLADEPTTALDVTTQEEVMAILNEQRAERGLAMIFVTHDLDLATSACDRIAVMYAGSLVEQRDATELGTGAAHPYTRALMAARPGLSERRGQFQAVPGRPVAAFEAVAGCAFQPRCPYASEKCLTDRPAVRLFRGGLVACHNPQEPESRAVEARAAKGVHHG